MGAEIDRLEIQIESKATKANNALDSLVSKLEKLEGSLKGINSSGLTGLSNGIAKFAQASAQLSNVKTADFTRLTKNIQSLANLNTQQIYSAASSIRTLSTAINSLGGVSANSLQVAQVASDISRLWDANVQRAIVNLPAFATEMNNLMATLSRAPHVSDNVIQMTRSLANLASQGAKVGTASNSIINSMNRVGTSTKTATKKIRSFSSVLGSLYQQFFWVSRGIDKLWDSVENSMGYVENLNYFNSAFGQVADAAVSQWKEAGFDSAEEYYESFSTRAKQLTSQMTGFNINNNGTLTDTGNASLGIDPSKLMNYQAMFAQMSSSMGVTSETSMMLSEALTKIGADLASVKNMDTEMVRSILEGRKTVTRRLVKPKNKNACGFYVTFRESDNAFMGVYDYDENERQFDNSQTPPAYVGDILYVRETWNICTMDIEENAVTFIYRADKSEEQSARTVKVSDELWDKLENTMKESNPEWRPSIHMPKEAARIFLKVRDVCVEKLQDMWASDVSKEGMNFNKPHTADEMFIAFSELWNSTIKRSDLARYDWDANPWVWVIEFERIEPELG